MGKRLLQKVSRKNDGSSVSGKGKIPILKVVQVLVAAVIGFYVAFLVSTTRQATSLSDGATPERIQPDSSSSSSSVQRKAAEMDNPQQSSTTATITIGYAVSVTGCGSDPLEEGAAVLKHSIHLTSIHGNTGNNTTSNKSGKYDYQMYAIYHPQAAPCVASLQELGYILLERDTPIAVADMEGDWLRTHIEKNGCCGEKELIKLEAYTLIQHPVVVHLDLDVLILQPLDPLFDAMIQGATASNAQSRIKVQWPEKPFTEQPNAFITRDYNMNRPGNPYPPVQGGFLVVRPDMAVYQEYLDIIKKGDFQEGKGWGGKVGAFYGGMTIQGLVPYYYDVLHPHDVVELDPCQYNQMCNNPRDKPTVNDIVNGRCRTGQDECQDCRSLPLEQVITTHFTLCQKPWWCLPQDEDRIQSRLCRKLHHAWYQTRSSLEVSWGRPAFGKYRNHKWKQGDHFFGFCRGAGGQGYIPIAKPYGTPIAKPYGRAKPTTTNNKDAAES
ncbi:expressed unknown protein [Seminavis robusta]|uniref:Nucleotide-diphospho-sugar transferase n=1 Tax=Seminavis robusta TaxID=568900 RepID=A0A9N8HN31_9STRA|nr:expressed unknown protein [Seminavis robusta]|eukprot:Sro954_g224271.1  (496) ;mRNA; f:2032-3604